MEEFTNAVVLAFDGNERALAFCQNVVTQRGWQFCMEVLASSRAMKVQFFCLQCIIDFVGGRDGFDVARYVAAVRRALLEYLWAHTETPCMFEDSVKNKFAQALTTALKCEVRVLTGIGDGSPSTAASGGGGGGGVKVGSAGTTVISHDGVREVNANELDMRANVFGDVLLLLTKQCMESNYNPTSLDMVVRVLNSVYYLVVKAARDVKDDDQTMEFELCNHIKDMLRVTGVSDTVQALYVLLNQADAYAAATSDGTCATLVSETLRALSLHVSWIDIRLVGNEHMVAMYSAMLMDARFRYEAASVVLEVVSKGMDARSKVRLIGAMALPSLLQQCMAAVVEEQQRAELMADAAFVERQMQFLIKLGKVVNVVDVELWTGAAAMQKQATRTGDPADRDAASRGRQLALHSKELVGAIFAHPHRLVSLTVLPAENMYLAGRFKGRERSQLEPSDEARLKSMLAVLRSHMMIPNDEQSNLSGLGIGETMSGEMSGFNANSSEQRDSFAYFRKELSHLFRNVCRVSPFNLVAEFVHETLRLALQDLASATSAHLQSKSVAAASGGGDDGKLSSSWEKRRSQFLTTTDDDDDDESDDPLYMGCSQLEVALVLMHLLPESANSNALASVDVERIDELSPEQRVEMMVYEGLFGMIVGALTASDGIASSALSADTASTSFLSYILVRKNPRSLSMVFFEVCVRYSKLVRLGDRLGVIVRAFLDDRGLHNRRRPVRERCCYLLLRFVKNKKNYMTPLVGPIYSATETFLAVRAERPVDDDTAVPDDVNGRAVHVAGAAFQPISFLGQRYLYEMLGNLLGIVPSLRGDGAPAVDQQCLATQQEVIDVVFSGMLQLVTSNLASRSWERQPKYIYLLANAIASTTLLSKGFSLKHDSSRRDSASPTKLPGQSGSPGGGGGGGGGGSNSKAAMFPYNIALKYLTTFVGVVSQCVVEVVLGSANNASSDGEAIDELRSKCLLFFHRALSLFPYDILAHLSECVRCFMTPPQYTRATLSTRVTYAMESMRLLNQAVSKTKLAAMASLQSVLPAMLSSVVVLMRECAAVVEAQSAQRASDIYVRSSEERENIELRREVIVMASTVIIAGMLEPVAQIEMTIRVPGVGTGVGGGGDGGGGGGGQAISCAVVLLQTVMEAQSSIDDVSVQRASYSAMRKTLEHVRDEVKADRPSLTAVPAFRELFHDIVTPSALSLCMQLDVGSAQTSAVLMDIVVCMQCLLAIYGDAYGVFLRDECLPRFLNLQGAGAQQFVEGLASKGAKSFRKVFREALAGMQRQQR